MSGVQTGGVAASPSVGVVRWLYDAKFDLTLIGVTAAWALGAGLCVSIDPSLFLPILALDIWLLGYQHVVATFTRLAFDADSFRANRFLVVQLPILVAASTIAASLALGSWIIATVYLYWQWFHYTRQSYGISRMYLRKAGRHVPSRDLPTFGVIYLVPLVGILRRSAQQPDLFLGMPVKCPPVPIQALYVVALLAGACLLVWLIREGAAYVRGETDGLYASYVLSHVAVFTTGYLLISNIDHGWLVLNIWHNAQYVMIVWMHNNNRFHQGVDPRHRFLSTISQRRHAPAYFLVCIGLATVLYLAVQQGLSLLANQMISASLVGYMIINFHHYIVDAIIWRRRRVGVLQRSPAT